LKEISCDLEGGSQVHDFTNLESIFYNSSRILSCSRPFVAPSLLLEHARLCRAALTDLNLVRLHESLFYSPTRVRLGLRNPLNVRPDTQNRHMLLIARLVGIAGITRERARADS